MTITILTILLLIIYYYDALLVKLSHHCRLLIVDQLSNLNKIGHLTNISNIDYSFFNHSNSSTIMMMVYKGCNSIFHFNQNHLFVQTFLFDCTIS